MVGESRVGPLERESPTMGMVGAPSLKPTEQAARPDYRTHPDWLVRQWRHILRRPRRFPASGLPPIRRNKRIRTPQIRVKCPVDRSCAPRFRRKPFSGGVPPTATPTAHRHRARVAPSPRADESGAAAHGGEVDPGAGARHPTRDTQEGRVVAVVVVSEQGHD